jgi:hypothetical protein
VFRSTSHSNFFRVQTQDNPDTKQCAVQAGFQRNLKIALSSICIWFKSFHFKKKKAFGLKNTVYIDLPCAFRGCLAWLLLRSRSHFGFSETALAPLLFTEK